MQYICNIFKKIRSCKFRILFPTNQYILPIKQYIRKSYFFQLKHLKYKVTVLWDYRSFDVYLCATNTRFLFLLIVYHYTLFWCFSFQWNTLLDRVHYLVCFSLYRFSRRLTYQNPSHCYISFLSE